MLEVVLGGLADDVGAEAGGEALGEMVGFHYDELTGITLVHTTGPAGDTSRAGRQVEVLETALGRCLTAELIGGLSPSPT